MSEVRDERVSERVLFNTELQKHEAQLIRVGTFSLRQGRLARNHRPQRENRAAHKGNIGPKIGPYINKGPYRDPWVPGRAQKVLGMPKRFVE